MTRKLTLKTERLTELTTAELGVVVGGASGHASCECPSYSWYCVTGGAICDTLLCP